MIFLKILAAPEEETVTLENDETFFVRRSLEVRLAHCLPRATLRGENYHLP